MMDEGLWFLHLAAHIGITSQYGGLRPTCRDSGLIGVRSGLNKKICASLPSDPSAQDLPHFYFHLEEPPSSQLSGLLRTPGQVDGLSLPGLGCASS